jgi:antitoxin component of MazEF toxin-antitoxin module
MPTQKYSKRNIRKIIKLGEGSLAVTLPKEFSEKLKLKEKQKVKMSLKGRSIIIKDWKP